MSLMRLQDFSSIYQGSVVLVGSCRYSINEQRLKASVAPNMYHDSLVQSYSYFFMQPVGIAVHNVLSVHLGSKFSRQRQWLSPMIANTRGNAQSSFTDVLRRYFPLASERTICSNMVYIVVLNPAFRRGNTRTVKKHRNKNTITVGKYGTSSQNNRTNFISIFHSSDNSFKRLCTADTYNLRRQTGYLLHVLRLFKLGHRQ